MKDILKNFEFRSWALAAATCLALSWVSASLSGCSFNDQQAGIIDETETIVTGTVTDSLGKPIAGARVSIHGDSLGHATKALARTLDKDSMQTVSTESDANGHYQLRGAFRGSAYQEIESGDSLGLLDSISFGSEKKIDKKLQALRIKGIVSIETATLDTNSFVWISQVNTVLKVHSDGSPLQLQLPPGVYTIMILPPKAGPIQVPAPASIVSHDTSKVTAQVPWTAGSMDTIANWSFDDASNLLQDASGNHDDCIPGEGLITWLNGAAEFNGASGCFVSLAGTFKRNDFIVEARVRPTAFGPMQNIIVAEPPGTYGDGWQLRLDEGRAFFHVRDSSRGTTWFSISTPTQLPLSEWSTIRVERSADSVWMWVNGLLMGSASFPGDISNLQYNLGIGYDAMNQAMHERYFSGSIDYIRIFTNKALPPSSSSVASSSDVASSSSVAYLANWTFDNQADMLVDQSGNGLNLSIGEGTPTIQGGTLLLDNASGFTVAMSPVLQRNDIVIETAVNPSSFGALDNIIVSETAGNTGDGWILRLESGTPYFYVRDYATQGSSWSFINATAALGLNAWSTIKVVRKADATSLWVNGNLAAQQSIPGDIGQQSYPMGIGYDAANQGTHDRYFDGKIAFIRISAP